VPAPVVCSALASKELCQLFRMHGAMATDFRKDLLLKLRQVTNPSAMDQLPEVSGQKSIRIKAILFKLKRSVMPLEIAGAITLHSLAKNQIVCPGGSPDRISLYKAEPIKRCSQSRRAKERMRYRIG